MLSIRNIALTLILGLAASAIITNRATAEEKTTLPRPSPFVMTASESKAELRDMRDTLAAERKSLDEMFATPEAALEVLRAAWKRDHLAESFPTTAIDAATELVAIWKSKDVVKTRELAIVVPIAALEAAMKSGTPLRPGQIAALRLEKAEFARRVASLRKGMELDGMIVFDKARALLHLDIQARLVTDEERNELAKKYDDRRAANREALGTARFRPMFDGLKASDARFSTEIPELGEEPSGTRLEVLFWRFQERASQLRDLAQRRGELEAELRKLHAIFSPVAPGDPTADVDEARSATWTAIDEWRAVDQRQVKTAIAAAQLRAQLWKEAASSVGAPENEMRSDLLEVGCDRLLEFVGEGSEPARVRHRLDKEQQAVLDREAGDRIKASLQLLSRALADMKESDAMSGDGVREGFGGAADLVFRAYGAAAFAKPETFLDGSIPQDVLKKLGEDGAPSKKFWSTQELRMKLGSDDPKVEAMAVRLQAERLLTLLGEK
ncbi:MAG: hypothetical protein AAB074_22945 [Planctomycetota bacterium]